MSKPLVLELKEKIASLEEKFEWKSRDVNLGFSESTTIEEIKNANEVQIYTESGNTIKQTLYFTKAESGKWLQNGYVEWNTNKNFHAIATVDFSTGIVQNGGSGDTSNTIKRISWR